LRRNRLLHRGASPGRRHPVASAGRQMPASRGPPGSRAKPRTRRPAGGWCQRWSGASFSGSGWSGCWSAGSRTRS